MTIFRCVDIESTGINTQEEKHAICEVGWTDLVRTDDEDAAFSVQIGDPVAELTNPGRAIPAEASAIHHITDKMVAGKRSPDQAFGDLSELGNYCVAHVADFEREFYTGGTRPWICTYKVALRVMPEAPNHKLQTLRYHLAFDDLPGFDAALASPAHRAGPDTYVTAWLLGHLMKLVSVAEMVRWSKGPALLITCWLKKHRGELWSEVAKTDPGYLRWVDENIHDDRDVRATARYYLKKLQAQSQGATT